MFKNKKTKTLVFRRSKNYTHTVHTLKTFQKNFSKKLFKMAEKTRAYGYWTLNLFGGRVSIPVKFMMAIATSDEDKRIPLKQSFNGRPVRTIKVISVDDKGSDDNADKIIDVEDVERVVQSAEIEKAILKNGHLVKVSEFDGLEQLIAEHHNKKWKDRTIEVLGCYALDTLEPWSYNGRQFILCPGANSKEKAPSEANVKMFKCLQDYLKRSGPESKKYLHIRFSSNCATAQELGALYVDNKGLVRISGLVPEIDMNEVKFPTYETKVDDSMTSIFGQKMDKVYDATQAPASFVLTWFNYVRKSLEEQGVREKFVEKTVVNNPKVDASLMDTLMDI